MNLFAPNVAYADFDSFLIKVDNLIINPLISLLFALAVAYFLFGVFEFLMNQENEDERTNGKKHMIWGIVGITIMMGVWGILSLIVNTLGINNDLTVDPDNPDGGSIDVHLQPYNPTYPQLGP